MKSVILPLVVVVVCLVNDTASGAISAATGSPLAVALPGNISGGSSVQPGDTMMRRPDQARTLSFEERVMYQRAIEQVYWRHRIWPEERPDPKPTLEVVMTQAQLEAKVTEYERNSQALEDHWHRSITAEQLQAEMDRMAQHTKQPDVLQELYDALGDDPFVIAECLARPLLVGRLVTNAFGYHQKSHGESKQAGRADPQIPKVFGPPSANYTLPTISDSAGVDGCTDNTWTATRHPPVPRVYHTAVWTGSEMIIWGGSPASAGVRYDPSTDSWTSISSFNAPSARRWHTAIWTGSEMIVWGGYNDNHGYLNTGGRYNPITDSWTATSTTNTPSGRIYHTMVWTGNEMIVWGGYAGSGYLNTGGRYNPARDTWTATNTVNAPSGREWHVAVWTGSEMIVWSGNNVFGFTNSGGRYNPGTNSWIGTSTTNTPSPRRYHTAVWTGSEMIVWGGDDNSGYTNTGGRYNPATNSWIATNTINAPSGRDSHTAIWTGSGMIVWGGSMGGYNPVNTGGIYNPGMDSWTATSTIHAPAAREGHTAIWTGNEMIVWGGSITGSNGFDTGGRYNPSSDTWTIPSQEPFARTQHTAVWTGSEMIVWGGIDDSGYSNTGERYHPSTDSWEAMTVINAPVPRYKHSAVWTGSEMIVWGGSDGTNALQSGGRYNPGTDSWIATTMSNVPNPRESHTAVWTGSEMIVWGGSYSDGSNRFYLNTGAKYNPVTGSWTDISLTGAPSPRELHTSVWTGSEMVVWGGNDGNNYLNTGGRYNPSTDSWTATSNNDAASGRDLHTAVWTGTEMIVWGGQGLSGFLNSGGTYNPTTDNWVSTTPNPFLYGFYHSAVWTGSEMIVWGGYGTYHGQPTNIGARYNPNTDSWTGTSTTNAPYGRAFHTAVWTGSQMIVWGGEDFGSALNTGGRYCAQPPSVLDNISTRASVQAGNDVMIGGFIVQGTQTKRVIIRAIGPELSRYGVPNPLFNPTLELHDGTGALIASNDNWTTTIIGGIITSNQVAEIRSSGHAPTDGRESAIIADLLPGNYTAIVRGVDNMTGVALVEAYDLSSDINSILGNISTRSFVQTGDDVMIGGFIVDGTRSKKVIIRAIGPELSGPPFNIPDALANPTLELHDSTGALIAANDNWQVTIIGGVITRNQRHDIVESGHAPGDLRESAIIAELPSGNYTAIVRGVNNTTGVGLVEVYDLGE